MTNCGYLYDTIHGPAMLIAPCLARRLTSNEPESCAALLSTSGKTLSRSLVPPLIVENGVRPKGPKPSISGKRHDRDHQTPINLWAEIDLALLRLAVARRPARSLS